jgi:hypothetical protein
MKGCSCRVHLRCALAEDGLLVAVPVLMVLRTMRPTWLWLCSDHKYGADPAAWEEELPKPLPGNVCVNVEDLPDKLCESLAMLGVLLPLRVLPSSEEDGDSSCTKVVFSDTYFYTTVRTVQDDSLLLPLTLPECERDEHKSALSAEDEASDSEDDLPVTALAAHKSSKQQQQQQQQQEHQQKQQQQQKRKGRPAARVNECGHPERMHEAHGLCKPCYEKWRKGGCTPVTEYIHSITAAAASTDAGTAAIATATAAVDDATTTTAAATGSQVNPKTTACPHITAAHKALGMCRPCYEKDLDARLNAKKRKPEQHAAATSAGDAISKKGSAIVNKGSASGSRSVAERVQLSSSDGSSDEDEPIARMQGASKHAGSSSGASAAKRQKLSTQSTAAEAVVVVDDSDEEHSSASDGSMHASAKLATVCACGKKDVYKKNRCYKCYKHYKAVKRSAGTTEQQQQQLDSASDSAVQMDRYSAATATDTTVQQRTKTGEHKRRKVYSSDARSVQVERYSNANRFAAVTRLSASSSSQQYSSSSSSSGSGSNFSAVTAAMTDAANAYFPSAVSIAAGLPASSLQRTRHDLAQKYTHDWQLELVHNSRLRAAVNATKTPTRVQFSSSLCTVYKYVHNDLGVDEYAAASNSSEQCDDDDDDDDAATGTALQQLDRIKAEQRYPVHTSAQAAEVAEAVRSGGPVYQYTQQQQQQQQYYQQQQYQQWQRPPVQRSVRQDIQQLRYQQQQQQQYAHSLQQQQQQQQQQYSQQWHAPMQQPPPPQQQPSVMLQPGDIFVSPAAAAGVSSQHSSWRPSPSTRGGGSSSSSSASTAAKPGRLGFGMGLMRHSTTADSLDSASSDSVQRPVNAVAVSSSGHSSGSMHEHSVALALVDTVMRSTTVAKAKVGTPTYC